MCTTNLTQFNITEKLTEAYDPSLSPESPYPLDFLQSKLNLAAVLIPFLQVEGQWHLLFIRRTVNEKDRHGGQVAFPGGRCSPEDLDAYHAALRETYEETGIRPDVVTILGQLRDMITITGYRVTPIVGRIPWPYNVVLQPSEVSRIFTIPFFWLADPANREVRKRNILIQGQPIPVIYFKPYDGEILWGASARITLLLLEALGLSSSESRYG